tara:strand:+ start:223 stop:423 length:201 start_codon:yes stop_codon:yes gene_type:complete
MKRPLENNQVVFQYYNSAILVTDGNILGIMPQLERVCDNLLRSKDSLDILRSVIESKSRLSGYSRV